MQVPDPSLSSLRVRFPRRRRPQEESEDSIAILGHLADLGRAVRTLSGEVGSLRRSSEASSGGSSRLEVELPQLTRKPRGGPTESEFTQVKLPDITRKSRGVPVIPSASPTALPSLTRRPRAEPKQEEENVNVVVERLNEVVQTLGDRVDRLMEVKP